MATPSTPSRPEYAILSNEAALFSLKRPQLLALAKEHGVKGTGKNVELANRLFERGRELASYTPTAEDSMLDADESYASWALLKENVVPAQDALAEFGVRETASATSSWRSKATISASSSSSSIASTIRSAGASILRAFAEPLSSNESTPSTSIEQSEPTTDVPSIYPTLPESLTQRSVQNEPPLDPPSSSETDWETGGIRLVSSRSTVHSEGLDSMYEDEDAPPVPFLPLSAAAPTPAFVFGSPVQSPAFPPPAFSFAMPGTLFSSTSSSVAEAGTVETGKTAAELVMEEMNRRAAEAREAAGGNSSLTTSMSIIGRGTKEMPSPSKGSKEAFDMSHKRVFAQMDSIVHHYAAKRPHLPTSTSSSNLASISRSTSSRLLSNTVLAAPVEERSAKRLKPSASTRSGLNRLPSSNLVNGLREAGWSAAPTPSTSVSLASSLRAGPSSGSALTGKGKAKEVREDLKPVQEREKEARKRQLELAKARRKSQAASGGIGLGRTRPTTSVGPKPPGSTASRFLKSTFRKLAPSIASSSSSAPVPASTSSTTLPRSTSIPCFASYTASTSSRVAASAGATASPVASLRKQPVPGRKKFDLQESLKRPMTWKSSLNSKSGSSTSGATCLSSRPSPAFAAPSSASKRTSTLSRQPSARVANPGLLGAVKPGVASSDLGTAPALHLIEEKPVASTSSAAAPTASADDPLNIAAKLAALPSAPTTVFGSTAANTASTSTPLQALTNTPLSPTSANAAPASKKRVGPPLSSTRKAASSSTRLARGGEKAKGRAQIEGLESRARKVQAKAGGAAGGTGRVRKV
ncbi:hypothetical protein JCM11251_005647 [Rhodosporidiobolus azoricus]